MDLLRAVMVGPSGTPYEDSIFIFDLFLPADYPNTPPSVSYFSYGERLNPNLYETGKVCLSLLGTWSGQAGENWNPQSSNLLQVLISIQGLVLVDDPFYNEPGFEKQMGTEDGRVKAMRYNEGALLFTIRALNRCLRDSQGSKSLPGHIDDICRYELFSRGPGMSARLRGLLAEQPDPARQYGSAGFLRTLQKLLPATEESMQVFVGAAYQRPAVVVVELPPTTTEPEPDKEEESDDDDL